MYNLLLDFIYLLNINIYNIYIYQTIPCDLVCIFAK